MLRSPASLPRPAWARVSPFPSALVVPPHRGEPFLLFVLALMVFSSAFVVFDIFYNVMSLAAIGLFALWGLRIDRANMPLILFLVVYNFFGWVALQPYLDNQDSREFVVGTSFVATTAIFFCTLLNQNALARLNALKWGLVLGALIAALVGIAGALDIAGLGGRFTMYEGRLSGTFRDPNVIGSFLVLPALFLVNDIVRESRFRLVRIALLGPILLAWFLTYSRGSWVAMVLGLAILMTLIFITSHHAILRIRVAILAILAVAIAALGIAFLLSSDTIGQMFADRFVLQKDYDSGPSGRFGNQLRAIPELLSLPFGYGPNRHGLYFPENPHNTFMMAFSSYGWLGGITFIAFIGTTLVISLRMIWRRTPFQNHALVLFAALIPHIVQNFQIDTDRWRHLFMIYGLIWGLAAITRRWESEYLLYAHHAYRAASARTTPPGAALPA